MLKLMIKNDYRLYFLDSLIYVLSFFEAYGTIEKRSTLSEHKDNNNYLHDKNFTAVTR